MGCGILDFSVTQSRVLVDSKAKCEGRMGLLKSGGHVLTAIVQKTAVQ